MHPGCPHSADARILVEFRSERIYEHPLSIPVAFGQYMAIVTPVEGKHDARGNADHLAERAEDTGQLGTPVTPLCYDEFLDAAPQEVVGRCVAPTAGRVFG